MQSSVKINSTSKKKEEEKSSNCDTDNYYFLSFYLNYFWHHKKDFVIFLLLVIIIIGLDVVTFIYRFKLWVYFYSRAETLPISTSRKTTYFIAATIHNKMK